MKTEFIQTIDNIETKKKISIYELLGLIKDGKAPKKIRYNNILFSYEEDIEDYCDWLRNKLFANLFYDRTTKSLMNDEIEILDEEDEFIDIEEIKREYIYGLTEREEKINDRVSRFEVKINQLIKNQKKIINKLKEEGK